MTRENVFGLSFEEVQASLICLPRTDVEPDGFFVQSGEHGGTSWRLQGHLFELGGRLWRVDLSGKCPQQALDAVLQALGWPAIDVVFQLVRQGVTVDEGDFRRWAAVPAT